MEDLSRSLFPPGASRHDWAIDAGIALGIFAASVMPVMAGGFYATNEITLTWVAAAVGSTCMSLSVIARRHSPLIMMAGVTLGALICFLGATGPVPALIVVPITAYAVARHVPGRRSRWVLYVGAVGAILGPIQWTFFIVPMGAVTEQFYVMGVSFLVEVFLCAGAVVTPYAIGRRLHDSQIANEQARMAVWQRQQMEIAAREHRIRSAEVDSRNQIARELHDIVAHSLSVMIVQAEGGRALARKQPEAAAESLDVIAETGREALQEMRRIVGVLRSGPDAERATYAPAPSLTDVPDLVRRTTPRATLVVHGSVPEVSPTVGLTVYRVVQEALTNFLKHAGPDATAQVEVTYSHARVEVTVSDNGLGAVAGSDGRGFGLRGMAERVQAMGGWLEAGPHAAGGFEVKASLPYQQRHAGMRQTVPGREGGR